MEAMATDVCEQTCKASVAWIKREEEIAAAATATVKPSAASAGGGAGAASSPSPAPTNSLPSLFKQSSRLLTQTDALYQVVHELVQPSQRADLMGSIARQYARLFHAYFNSASGGGIVASQLSSTVLRNKLSKRMEATLDKCQAWLAPQDHAIMKQQLSVFSRPAPVATAAAATPRGEAAAPAKSADIGHASVSVATPAAGITASTSTASPAAPAAASVTIGDSGTDAGAGAAASSIVAAEVSPVPSAALAPGSSSASSLSANDPSGSIVAPSIASVTADAAVPSADANSSWSASSAADSGTAVVAVAPAAAAAQEQEQKVHAAAAAQVNAKEETTSPKAAVTADELAVCASNGDLS
jgi:hypothetical protein